MVGVQPLLSRRSALTTAGGAAAATLTGCGARAGAPTAGGTSPEDGDLQLLRGALDREAKLREHAVRTARQHPRLRVALRDLAAVHREHLEFLTQSVETYAAPTERSPIAAEPRAAALHMARDERALAEAHARAALDARSGPFARVLAGMAAAADQQAHRLDASLDSLVVAGRRR